METKITPEEIAFLMQASKEAQESLWTHRKGDRRRLFIQVGEERRKVDRRNAED